MIYTALIGYPTKHSLSPDLFKIYADSVGLEYSHLKIDVSPFGNELENSLIALKQLNFSGLNVTIPHKLNVINFLDEVDDFALKIGAVNTIKIKNGRLSGSNTDYIGVIRSIEKSIGSIDPESNVVIFGTGGAAKACTGGLLKHTKNITVCYREPESHRTKDFYSRFKDEVNFISDNNPAIKDKIIEANIICNATPKGMYPDVSNTILPIDISILKENPIERVFFDAVYTPLQTKFLTNAASANYQTANGLDMMIYQGIKAFEIWTGKEVNNDTANKARNYIIGLGQ